jgi:tRNA1Val (adenine37-N6)-methyltransferase
MSSQPDLHAVSLLSDERVDEVNESIRLIQKKNGLTFGTDAYLLAAFIRPQPSARAVDLGSVTGVIPLLLTARNKIASAVAVEVQPAFADVIARNAALNGLDARVTPLCQDLRTLTSEQIGGEVDLVLSNPPYMRCDSGKRNENEEKYIARHEACGTIADFAAAAGRLLRFGGKFVTVWRPDRLTELLYALRDAGMEAKRMTFVHADGESEPCMVLTEAVRGGAPAVRVSKPLFLYLPRREGDKSRTLTPDAARIYRDCSFE